MTEQEEQAFDTEKQSKAYRGSRKRLSRVLRLFVWSFGLFFVLYVAVTTHAFSRAIRLMSGPSVKSVVGDDGLEILRKADRVQAFRVSPTPSPLSQRDSEHIGPYRILATGDELDGEFASRLASAVLGHGVSPNRKKCGFDPGVAFRMWNGQRAVDVLICFKCDVLWAVRVDQYVESIENSPGWKDFDIVRARFVELAKEAFPHDSEVQELTERR